MCPKLQKSFRAAFWALLLAMGLPIAVAFFGSPSASELQRPADPKWVHYSPFAETRVVASTNSINDRRSNDSVQIPVRVACVVAEDSSTAELETRATMETSLTGSVTGRSSIEIPVHMQSSENPSPDLVESRLQREQALKKSRGLDVETGAVIAKSSGRIEPQVKHVRERIEDLSKRQVEHQTGDLQQQTQILKRQNQLKQNEAELLGAMKKLSEMTHGNSARISIENRAASNEYSMTILARARTCVESLKAG